MNTRRTRIVNFRVTEEEYQRLRSASHTLGSGGISGYARHATLYLAEARPKTEASPTASMPESVLACLAELKDRVAELEVNVKRLTDSSERMRETCV